MKLLRQLDTSIKLVAAFTLVMCLSTWLAVSLLSQLSNMKPLTAPAAQKLSAAQAKSAARPSGDYAAARGWVLLCIGGNIGVAGILALWLRAELVRPVRQAAAVARRVAEGDLRPFDLPSGPLARLHTGEDGRMLSALQEMNAKLSDLVSRMRAGSRNLSNGAGKIASSGRQLSARAEQHAASLATTATAMSQLNALIRHNGDQAGEAGALAQSAAAAAAGGGNALDGVSATLGALTKSARRIADTVNLIDDIAFQANILALHAAVEAARAGHQGTGFDILATEVRILAQRSASAARQIKDVIEDSTQQAATGTSLAEQAGLAMTEVSGGVKRVTALLAGIAEGGAAQAAGLSQANHSLAAMDEARRQHAVLADEAVASAADMRDQAGSLSRLVDAFQLGPEHAAPGPRIHLVASNPFKLSTPARAMRSSTTVMPVRHSQRGGTAP